MYNLNYLIDVIAIGYDIEAFYVKDDTVYDHLGHIFCNECPLGLSHECMASWKIGNAISNQLNGPYTYVCPLGLAFIILSNKHRMQCLPHDFLVVGPVMIDKDNSIFGQHLRAAISADKETQAKLTSIPRKSDSVLSYIADGIYLAYQGTYYVGGHAETGKSDTEDTETNQRDILFSGYSYPGLFAHLDSLCGILFNNTPGGEHDIDLIAGHMIDTISLEEHTDLTHMKNKLGAVLAYLCEQYSKKSAIGVNIDHFVLDEINEIARKKTLDEIRSSFFNALHLIYRRCSTSLTNCDAAIISQFESIVSTRYASPLTLKDIAKELNISYSYLSTLVNKVLQKRFGQYLIETRVNASLPLLRNSNLSIAEIAHQVGFADQSHFSKSFRSIYHLSPQQYRKSDQ